MGKWVLLHYKIPPEPSAPRVYIWRKLKRIGAILYQDAVWVLPDNPRTREQFQWLAAEVVDLGGRWIIPGLIQGHLHLGQTLFRGLAENRRLLKWLEEAIWPMEAAHTETRNVNVRSFGRVSPSPGGLAALGAFDHRSGTALDRPSPFCRPVEDRL